MPEWPEPTTLISLYDEHEQPFRWPEPTTPIPTVGDLTEWHENEGCKATDGCWVEPDGECEHGFPSWLVYLGLI